ncbi:DMT family transporter [Lignipirellula cremea]|uniref:EamA-like transporter family protein n=1 Tax=Lignipirellula cremea TaxID=2528010 RepID=A0A518DU76_9BACT|nr:DMT family transporter [Lignipirellula cremea]QDU95384.1 EamA-like transporter family protein [Lignipirellula cremea]
MLLVDNAEVSLLGPQAWLPLLAAAMFSLGAMFLKRSNSWPVGVWRTTFLLNMSIAFVFIPSVLLGGELPPWTQLWQPLWIAVLFVVGQIATIWALTRGDVSVAAPVLGLKIILVAVLAWALTRSVLPPDLWAAAALATLGVILLNQGGSGKRDHVLLSVVCALISAGAFALFDICVQEWRGDWGLGRLLPLVFLFSSVLSLGMIPLFEAPLREIPRPARRWLAAGCGLLAVQSLGIVFAVALFGKAPIANVFYSTRGLWGVLLAWQLGPWIGVVEIGRGGSAIWFRLTGALLLLISVTLLIL